MLINKENLNFLINLGKELKTQDNLGTRRPLIFKIMDIEIIECREGYEDFKKLYLYNGTVEIDFNTDKIDEIKAFCNIFPFLTLDAKERLNKCANLDDIVEFCDNYSIEYKLRYFCEKYICKEGFLTKKAAKKHLSKYQYKYSDKAKIYCSCAIENDEIVKLTEIIEKIYEENQIFSDKTKNHLEY